MVRQSASIPNFGYSFDSHFGRWSSHYCAFLVGSTFLYTPLLTSQIRKELSWTHSFSSKPLSLLLYNTVTSVKKFSFEFILNNLSFDSWLYFHTHTTFKITNCTSHSHFALWYSKDTMTAISHFLHIRHRWNILGRVKDKFIINYNPIIILCN